MKRKFEKPTMSNYGVQVAYGGDQMEGFCQNGSMPQEAGGLCTVGYTPYQVTCASGTSPDLNSCRFGNGVLPTPNCTVGNLPS